MKFTIFPWPDALGWSFLASLAICVVLLVAAVAKRDPLLVLIPGPYLVFCVSSFRRVPS